MAFGPTHARSRKVAEASAKGVHYLMKKNKITEVAGWGTLTGSTDGKHGVDVKGADGETTSHTCDDLIIATGATVRMLPGMKASANVVTYEEQILDEELPGSIIIGGSGAIGVEFAYVMVNFGVDVTIVEFLDRMVPTEDPDVSKELLKQYKKLGVKVMLATKVEEVEDTGSGIAADALPNIFDRHYQGGAKDLSGRAGLGLAIAKRIGELHAREIAAESDPGHGTTFEFELPAVP